MKKWFQVGFLIIRASRIMILTFDLLTSKSNKSIFVSKLNLSSATCTIVT